MNARRLACILTSALLIGALAAPVLALEATETEVLEVRDAVVSDEAWFYRFRQPLPELPQGDDDPTGGYLGIGRAEVRSRTNPFPLDTLHVAVVAGEPIARTYLGLSTFDVTDQMASITGGTLRLVDNEEDSVNAAAADMVACPTTDLVITDDAGDWDAQPTFDCAASSPLRLVEGSSPLTWEVDLDPFAEAFSGNLSPGIAILERGVLGEDGGAPDPTTTWHVSFDASTRDEAQLAPDTTALVTQVEALLRTLGDIENVVRTLQDPDAIPAFLVLQVLPDVNAVWAQSRVVRQTDPERELRPALADLELRLEGGGFAPLDDEVGADGSFGDAPASLGSVDAPASDAANTSFGGAPAGGTGAAAPATPGFESGAQAGDGAGDGLEAETAGPEHRAEPVEQTVAAAPFEEVMPSSGTQALLLLPLALSVAGALAWSLTQSPQVAGDRTGGALDRLVARGTGRLGGGGR